MRFVLVVALFACARTGSTRPRPDDLTTTAERSQYIRTARYDEAVRLCHDFAAAYDKVACDDLGQTIEGRPILALRITRRPGLPVIYIQAGIHAGEIEGKDAGFWFLRDLLDGKVAPGALDAVAVVFVPVVNPDGHERFGANHRPNQRGPEEMGFRTNAARLNLNRDYVKLDSPELQAIVHGAIVRHDPVVMIDLHTTDGAKFEHDISVLTSPLAPRDDALEETAAQLADHLMKRLGGLGHLPVPFYPSFVIDEDPASGFAIGEAPPRFSNYYAAARGRIGILVETHSWRTYKERATSTYHTLQAVFEHAIGNARTWRDVTSAASTANAALAGREVTLIWRNGPRKSELAFRGYAYDKRVSDLSGGTWLVYDEKTPQIWNVPLYDELVPAITVTAPRGGYVIDGGFAPQVAAILDRHGIRWRTIGSEASLAVETFRATKMAFQAPYEGRTRVALEGAWTVEPRRLERGAIFVPIDQPLARLVLHLFEPSLPDSLAQWGMFNVVFERKEYMEPYVIEEAARAMLAADPSLRAAFDAAVAADPAIAKDPGRKLEWFYRRHPAWDERVDLLPVYRVARAP